MKEVKLSKVDSITRKAPFSFVRSKDGLASPKKDEVGENTLEPEQPKGVIDKNPVIDKSKTDKKNFKFLEFKKRRHFSLHGAVIILLLLPIMLAGVVSYLYQTHNEGKIYSGVTTFGVDAGGKTIEEAGKLIDGKVAGYKLVIEGENQKFEAAYSDLGINYDKEKILNEAYNYGRNESVLANFFNRTKRFFSQYEVSLGEKKFSLQKHNVNLIYGIDEEKLGKYLGDLEVQVNVTPKDSQISTSGASMQVVPAVFGKKLKTAELRQQILTASTNFESAPIKIQTDVASPTILDEQTRVLAETADKVTSKSIVLTYQGKTYTPSKDTVVSWVTFTRANDASPWQMVIDPYKMAPYFKVLGKEMNVYSTDRKIRVENQVKEVVTQEGSNGLIIDEAALGSQIVSKLQSDSSVSLAIPMKVDYAKTKKEYVIVANWDKYIDVNISSQTMEAYLRGGTKVGQWNITSGKKGWETPIGTFLISRKAYNVCMPNPPEKDPLCGIHYVSYFTSQGHAIHEAWWRGSLGGMDYVWNGSHGCINATFSIAQFIYNWADIGTPVTIHY